MMLRAGEIMEVTPEQFERGYLLKVGTAIIKVDYRKINKTDYGTYIVTLGHEVVQ